MGSCVFQGPLYRSHLCDLHLCPLFFYQFPKLNMLIGGGGGVGEGKFKLNRITLKKKMQSHPLQSHLTSHFFRLPDKKLPLLTVSVYRYNPRSHDKYTQKHSGTSRAFFENKSVIIFAMSFNLLSQSTWCYGQPSHICACVYLTHNIHIRFISFNNFFFLCRIY